MLYSDHKVMTVSPKWQWLMEKAKEIGHGEATISFFQGEPVNVKQAVKESNYTAETRTKI
jgi:hypothetical protein